MELDTSMIVSFAGVFVALLSFGFAVYVYLRTDRKIKEQQGKINAFDIEIKDGILKDKSRAKVRAMVQNEIYADGKGGVLDCKFLVIENKGESVAVNVNIESDMFEQRSGVIAIIEPDLLPYPTLSDNGGNFKIPLNVSLGAKSLYSITITWDDRYAKNNEYTQSISC